MTQAAIAKRLATIAQEYAKDALLPKMGGALIRAGKAGASERTLANACGCTKTEAREAMMKLESGGFAMLWNETAEVWRIDTVQILAREERAALEALHAATAHERDAAATHVAKKLKDALHAQTMPAVCIECWRRDQCEEPRKPCAEGKATEREQRAKKGGKNGGKV